MVVEALTFHGRLPGVVCETALPARAEDPLRLDVAAFVGFAERGPLDTPILLEDINQYTTLFGGDLPIATDKGNPVYANLPSAVKAFFDNGGQRCYVVRVAGESARANHFLLPGLLAWGDQPYAVAAAAAWVGRWSDAMTVGVQLRSQPLKVKAGALPFTAYVELWDGKPALAAQIDLVLPTRDRVREGDLLLLTFGPVPEATYLLYFPVARIEQHSRGPYLLGVSVTVYTTGAQLFAVQKDLPEDGGGPAAPIRVDRLGPEGWASLLAESGALTEADKVFTMVLDKASDVAPGDLLRLVYAAHTPLLLRVKGLNWRGATPLAICEAPLGEVATADAQAALAMMAPTQVELLQFDLCIREGDLLQEEWPELRFGDDSDGWRQRLAVFGDGSPPSTLGALSGRSLRLRAPVKAPVVLPLSMTAVSAAAGALPEQLPPGAPSDAKLAGKDGLDTFDPVALFLDPDLRGLGRYSLLSEAEGIQFLREPSRLLRKLHSLVPIDEIALIALPDLVHRGFAAAEAPTPTAPPPVPEEPQDDRSVFSTCETPPAPPPPKLPEKAPCDELGAAVPPLPAVAALPRMAAAADFAIEPLLEVQRALVTLCAARADCMAILSLPQHFGRQEALDWCAQFTDTPDFVDGIPLSYAAAYHPWVQQPETATPQLAPLRAAPPDGAVCGMVAARERRRGAWIAPANEALRGVVRLDPTLTTADWEALYNRGINIVRQQPGRFALLSAHTLSSDRLLLQVSVRRLLIFLRKLALRRGQQFVFENNTPRFRQTVQVAFERTLTALAQRGAMTAFEVSTGPEYNTENDEFNGRMIVAIKIAPTNPIEFITLVMLRAGDSLLEVLER